MFRRLSGGRRCNVVWKVCLNLYARYFVEKLISRNPVRNVQTFFYIQTYELALLLFYIKYNNCHCI